MKKLVRLVVAVGLLGLAACSNQPVYKVTYDYTMPSKEGNCVAQCQSSRMACEANRINEEKLTNRQCAQNLHQQYRQCVAASLQSQVPANQSGCGLDLDICQVSQVDYSSCTDMYHQCFQACGGKVEEQRRCVNHCGAKSQ